MNNPHAQLLEHLPHRPPFRFVSRIVAIEPGRCAEGAWELTGAEDFFAGHFPGRPFVPGVLIAEALAQLSGIVAFADQTRALDEARASGASGESGLGAPPVPAMLVHVDVRLKTPVQPPATLELRSTLTRAIGPLRQFDVEARCLGRLVARGTLAIAAAPAIEQIK